MDDCYFIYVSMLYSFTTYSLSVDFSNIGLSDDKITNDLSVIFIAGDFWDGAIIDLFISDDCKEWSFFLNYF